MQELRFRASHLMAVQASTKRITMRFEDPVEAGPALFTRASNPPTESLSSASMSTADEPDE